MLIDPALRQSDGRAETQAAWQRRSIDNVWHPCTQMQRLGTVPPLPIARGEGAWLHDYAGARYFDANSSWWVNLFGHADARINAALRDQLETLPHVMLAGCTHAPAVELAERLRTMTGGVLGHAFYASDGASAVEIALKMSFHYWRNAGEPGRTRFVNLTNSYHGETLGALAAGDVSLYKTTYEPLLMGVLTVPSPDCWHRAAGESCAEHSRRMLEPMREALERHAGEVCAVIVEPLVQCAGSMRMYDPIYLRLLRELCDRHRVHLIADEVAVGFGRTGTLFACEQAGISPDFLCLSKGLTAGYLPLAATLTTERVYQAFYDDYATLRAFLHSHSYTGNALGCRAALASLDIFEQDDVCAHNRELSREMAQAVAPLADHPHVGEVRQHGMILAVELVRDRKTREPYAWQERRGLRVYRHALGRGVLLRPLGDVVYFMPPYVITPEQIHRLAEVAREGIELATADFGDT